MTMGVTTSSRPAKRDVRSARLADKDSSAARPGTRAGKWASVSDYIARFEVARSKSLGPVSKEVELIFRETAGQR
jgi:hypothetical protein